MLVVKPYRTPIFHLNEDLINFILKNVGEDLQEGDVLAITSKIVSLWKNRIVPFDSCTKEELIKKESDVYLGQNNYNGHLTIKENQLIPAAGIDESNCSGQFWILFPEEPFKVAQAILNELKKQLNLKKLGVLITDSKTTPLRRGVTGTALSYAGFRGVENKISQPDLFGRPLVMTQINVADALAVSAVFMMGEGNESCPLATIKTSVSFCENLDSNELKIPPTEDLYAPLFSPFLKKLSDS